MWFDGQISAQKAEQIYGQKQVLQSIRDHIMKLEIEQSMNDIQGLPRNGDLDLRINAARARRDEKADEVEQMEGDYQTWLRADA